MTIISEKSYRLSPGFTLPSGKAFEESLMFGSSSPPLPISYLINYFLITHVKAPIIILCFLAETTELLSFPSAWEVKEEKKNNIIISQPMFPSRPQASFASQSFSFVTNLENPLLSVPPTSVI